MSCDKEKMSIPLEAHHKAQSSKNFSKFSGKNLKELSFFHLLANPAETAYLNFWDRELSNDVWLVEFWWREVVVHTFLWVVTGHCLSAGFMESRNLFCLTSYPGEISHSNSANRELSNEVLGVVVRRREVAFHTSSHLTPIEAWQRAVSTISDKSSWSKWA